MKTVHLFWICWLFFVSACGYHLRGTELIPDTLKNLYLIGASPQFQAEAVSMLKSANGQLVNSPESAGIVIRILKEDMHNRVVSIGTTGKSTESEVNYYIRFQLFDNKDNPLQEEQTLEVSREFFNDQTAVLAKSSEELLIRTELYKQVVRMVFARAKSVIENPKP